MKMWITRNSFGILKMHLDEPKKICWGREIIWSSEHNWSIRFINPFPEVTFENSPMEVELIIKK